MKTQCIHHDNFIRNIEVKNLTQQQSIYNNTNRSNAIVSSMVSGNLRLRVSGSKRESRPATTAHVPNTDMGKTRPTSPLTTWPCNIMKRQEFLIHTLNCMAGEPDIL